MHSRSLANRIKKQGMPPGSLVAFPTHPSEKIRIDLVDYTSENVVILENTTLEESLKYLKSSTCTWLNIRGLCDIHFFEQLGAALDLHPLILEDILNPSQRCKVDDYKSNLFIVLRVLSYDEKNKHIRDDQISIIFSANYVITISEKDNPFFDPIKQRIQSPQSRIRRNSTDYLCYAIIDSIVDYYFIILAQLDTRLTKLEDSLTKNNGDRQSMEAIQKLKKDIFYVQKAVWPVRELINQLIRNDSHLFQENIKIYLHDVYDHAIQAIETIDNFRDQTYSLVDLFMSFSSQKLNETIKVLTVVSTIFVPLTFLASLYGMNFEKVPGLKSEWGFYILLTLMLLISLSMILFFRNKKWI